MPKPASATKEILLLLVAAAFYVGSGLVSLLLAYGVVVIVFRYAFGVQLWNPFG